VEGIHSAPHYETRKKKFVSMIFEGIFCKKFSAFRRKMHSWSVDKHKCKYITDNHIDIKFDPDVINSPANSRKKENSPYILRHNPCLNKPNDLSFKYGIRFRVSLSKIIRARCDN